MSNYKQKLGNRGEELAERYLIKKGYTILERNYRRYRGEIDIIAKDQDYLVFVEVKTARSNQFGDPVYRVGRKKKQQIGKIAMAYYQEHELYDQDSRFDIITINITSRTVDIKHIENAFWLEAPN